MYYKWRIDADNPKIDIYLHKKRNHKSAYTFIKRLIKKFAKLKLLLLIRHFQRR